MKRILLSATAALMLSTLLPAQELEANYLKQSGEVMLRILISRYGIPLGVLDRAECVAVFPSAKKLAIEIAGSYRPGAMTCRGGDKFTGPWGPPAIMALEGTNLGFQQGGQYTDYVLLVVNPKSLDSILKSKVKLGADASAAIGPMGRDAEAATDVLMKGGILTYSRYEGLVGGVSLAGSTLRADNSATEKVYGLKVSARDVIVGQKVETSTAGNLLVKALQETSPVNKSDLKSLK